MTKHLTITIAGEENGIRIESRILEERIQRAVADGCRSFIIRALGQHGIGGRLWNAGDEKCYLRIDGPPGQRVGSMGFFNTKVEVMGPASDDVGWLNAGAEIIIHGHAGNGVANAMAQGKIYIAGNIGARGMTMTKQNPRFTPPELWVLGSAGDYFAEFMAGGIAVICGHQPQTPDNVLGYRPMVGMVGGKVFFRGPHAGFSRADARLIPMDDADYQWLLENLTGYLAAINRPELFEVLSERDRWQLITARSPQEKSGRKRLSMSRFHTNVWNRELGRGGLIGDLTEIDRDAIPLITTGELRRFVPVWENRAYLSPCQASCPSGIPVQERWRLIREDKIGESVDLAVAYTPFPAAICGYLCPQPCMHACTRRSALMTTLDPAALGRASINAEPPDFPPVSKHRLAVIGGGPAGISTAWQLRRRGHEAVVYDREKILGGKISQLIPNTRIPQEVIDAELARIRQVLSYRFPAEDLTPDAFEKIKSDHEMTVVAVGAQKPRSLSIPGVDKAVLYTDFLKAAKTNTIDPGKRIVIIGAGNVGCDVATEAHRLGSRDILLIDVQKPASFGKEREDAEAAGARFQWPVHTREITDEGVTLTDGQRLPADTVVISIGDIPDLEFLPESVACERGFIDVNEFGQTSDPKVFAIGDAVKPGLLTDAIGAGRRAAHAIADILDGKRPMTDVKRMIDIDRVSLEYFDPRIADVGDVDACGDQCASCGACRDCNICETVCPKQAVSRVETKEAETGYEYVVNGDRCIGCGFCAGACPCGVWGLFENDPME